MSSILEKLLTDVKDGLHKSINAVKRPRLAIIGRNLLVKVLADILGLLFEDGLHFPDVGKGKGIGQHLAVSLVLLPFHKNQAMASDLFCETNEPVRLGEGVAVLVKNVFVGGNAVRHENLIVEEAKIANKWCIRVFFHPLDIERSWCWCLYQIYELSKEEMVILVRCQSKKRFVLCRAEDWLTFGPGT